MIHFVVVAVLVLITTFLLGTFVNLDNFLPAQASQQAVAIDWLFGVHGWLIAFFFSLIVVFILYSVVVFRRRNGELGDGVYMTGNLRLEIIWTVVPLIIVLALAVIGADSLAEVERRTVGELQVDVYASQWNWRFQYENGATSNVLVLPKDQAILLRLHSSDVIHSFFVPEFRLKQDVLPGGEEFTRELRVTPTVIGEYKIRCAEICGQLHYSMLADVSVVDAAEFNAWLADAGASCSGGPEACGQRWAEQFGCVACHSTDGSVIVGPSWLGLVGREAVLEDGSTVIVDDAYIHESIVDPNAKIVEGFVAGVMPQNFAEILTEEQINDLTAFILSLR
ncbi:MAG: cytochrome c oxidase subunit II [Chloroflexi bacterium]|nr:cytochrome c oxidase subunit II [Chloroflexota bacterium]